MVSAAPPHPARERAPTSAQRGEVKNPRATKPLDAGANRREAMITLSRRFFLAGATAAGAGIVKPAVLRAAEPLNISVVLGNSIHWVQFAAVDKGFYKDVGFDAKLSALQSSPQSLQMALSGEWQIATSQPETFVAAVEQGATILGAMSAPTNRCDWVLTGARGLKTIAELKDKVIGISSLRATEAWLTTRLLAKNGIKADEYKFVVAGTSPAKVAALEAGAVAAAVLFQPSAELAIRRGLVALGRYQDLRAYPTIVYVVNKGWAAQGDAGRRVASVLQRTHAWLADGANRAEALKILAKYTKREIPILETVYDEYFVTEKLYSTTGQIDLDGLRAVLADMAVDGSVLKKAPAPEKYILDKSLGGLFS